MSQEGVGNRYARAIFEIGVETKTAPALAREIAAFVETYEASSELRLVLRCQLLHYISSAQHNLHTCAR
jgi:F0F1-type ATP synthase delta subunit